MALIRTLSEHCARNDSAYLLGMGGDTQNNSNCRTTGLRVEQRNALARQGKAHLSLVTRQESDKSLGTNLTSQPPASGERQDVSHFIPMS
ncbi:hypothetical protein Dd1591_2750 [Dickeya chrysanthemi Ech1591]|uniref:Uncharacterized protein n=1 Tax=Dickeya chrysanthemi (strain Ech1591) TaxID=561229 RepID=C6CN49_DICC1|nr:hypothetical protein [Dickeya chrysanthemi]ACT07574.1 hypothetical protein Dd1591_2750 [Dickeya chrysanthemi Ech1591]